MAQPKLSDQIYLMGYGLGRERVDPLYLMYAAVFFFWACSETEAIVNQNCTIKFMHELSYRFAYLNT